MKNEDNVELNLSSLQKSIYLKREVSENIRSNSIEIETCLKRVHDIIKNLINIDFKGDSNTILTFTNQYIKKKEFEHSMNITTSSIIVNYIENGRKEKFEFWMQKLYVIDKHGDFIKDINVINNKLEKVIEFMQMYCEKKSELYKKN